MDVNEVLMWVDVDRWGPRKAQLVALVEELSAGTSLPVPVGRADLVEMGRTADQAKHDHRRLCELADDRVLRRWRGSGRQPDCWQINPAVDNWRAVTWNAPRRTVMSFFFGRASGRTVALRGIGPGQALRRGALPPLQEGSGGGPLSEDRRPPTKRHCPPTQQITLTTEVPLPPYATDRSAPDYAFKRLNYIQSVQRQTDRPTEEPQAQQKPGETDKDGQYSQGDPGVTLLEAVRAVVSFPVWGSPADRIRELARSHPERVGDLVETARTLEWCKTPAGVLQALQAVAEARAPSQVVDVAARREQLARMIATWRQADVDEDRIKTLESELEALNP